MSLETAKSMPDFHWWTIFLSPDHYVGWNYFAAFCIVIQIILFDIFSCFVFLGPWCGVHGMCGSSPGHWWIWSRKQSMVPLCCCHLLHCNSHLDIFLPSSSKRFHQGTHFFLNKVEVTLGCLLCNTVTPRTTIFEKCQNIKIILYVQLSAHQASGFL